MKTRTLVRSSRADRGFTVVELMIAMTIGLVLLTVVSSVLLGSMQTSSGRERDSDIHVNGRYAVDTVRRDLNHAGFLGISSLFWPDDPVASSIATVTNVCDAAFIGKLSRRVWAANDSNPYSASCLPTANYLAGTDVLVVRHLSTNPVTGPYTTAAPLAANFNSPYTAFDANALYFHSSYEGGEVFRGNGVPPNFTVSSKQPPYYDYLLEEYVYYISPWTVSATESPRIPALYRLRLVAGSTAPAMVPELVASGVEDLQVRLGQIGSGNSGSYLSPAEVTDWDSIHSLEVSMLLRSATRDPKLTAAQTYDLGATNVTKTDGIPRRVYSLVVQLRN